MFPVTQELRIRRQLARRGAGVLHIVNQIDGILAACEDEGLRHGQSLTIRPSQRHPQFLGARGKHEGFLHRTPCRKMRRRGFAGSADETGLQQVQGIGRLTAQKSDRDVRRVLTQRILQEIGLIELAAFQIDHHVEHIGADMHRL